MPKGVPNKRYTGEFNQMVVAAMIREKLSYREAARRFRVDRPNAKWVTGVSYIHTNTQQAVNLVLDTIRLATKKEEKTGVAPLTLRHSARNFIILLGTLFVLSVQTGAV